MSAMSGSSNVHQMEPIKREAAKAAGDLPMKLARNTISHSSEGIRDPSLQI